MAGAASVVCFILRALDVAAWLVSFGPLMMIMKMIKSRPKVRAITNEPDTARTRAGYSELTCSPFPEESIFTLFDLHQYVVKKYADRPCLGTRAFLGKADKPDPAKGQRFPPEIFGETSWISYAEFGEQVRAFGSALRDLGMVSHPDVDDFEKVSAPCTFTIYENTCADWMIASHGCFSQSMVCTTVYATLGVDAVVAAINECGSTTLLCNRVNVKALADKASEMPTLKNIIYTEDKVAPKDRLNKLKHDKVKVFSMEEILEMGKKQPREPVAPTPRSMAVIMYTSGSTGKPKGVLITHKALLAMIAGLVHHFLPYIKLGREVYAAFLPLAHILELAAENAQLSIGSALGYCDPRTLTSSGSEPLGALEEFKPTLMAAVPKIWDIIKKGAEAKAKAAGGLRAALFQYAVQSKVAAMKWGISTPLFDLLVFSKIKKITGGRLKIAISGGGPIDEEVQSFCSAAICPIIQGYGLTETCGGGAVQFIGDTRVGVVGMPLSSLQVKLVDARTEDNTEYIMDSNGVPYRTTDVLNANGEPCLGRGEVLIGGNVVTSGYYKMPKETKEAYLPGGYFATGDIGEWTPDGSLKIVDRKKNLVKLKGGEYVAIEHMEMKFNNSVFVDALAGGILVYAGGDVDRSVAYVQVNKGELEKWAKTEGIDVPYPQLINDARARKVVFDSLAVEGKKGGLGDLEKLFNVTLLDGQMGQGPDAWTPQNGGLTATNKLQRKTAIKERFEKGKVDARQDWMRTLK